MKCVKCSSENVQVQVVTKKNKITGAIVLMLLGFGLMFLGIVGAVLGALLGWIIGMIVKGLMGELQETVAVCQDCGHTFPVKN